MFVQGTGGKRDGPGLSWLTFQKGTRCQRRHLSQSDDSHSGDEGCSQDSPPCPGVQRNQAAPWLHRTSGPRQRFHGFTRCHCNQGTEGRCTSLFPIPTDPLGSGNSRSHLPGGSGEEPISQASPTQLPAPVLVNFRPSATKRWLGLLMPGPATASAARPPSLLWHSERSILPLEPLG